MAAKPQAPAHLKPAFELLPLTAEDAPRCVDIYFAAFQNPHSLACWPRVPSIRAFWEHMILDELAEPGAHWLKAVRASTDSPANSTSSPVAEQIAGFCKWVAPKPGQVPDTTLPQWPTDADGRLCDETFGAWAKAHKELLGDRGHWYLEIVATDPAYQGQGAGSQILRWGTERADADDMEAYLEAAPDAVRLYEKFGFREAGRTDTFIENERVNGEWYRNLYMLRPAAKKGN
ncbi:hypothetical protein B0A48_00842 [Cryoendolithus antarcticus]|uniref:N-acetyltransferase domain-containing protein n=1 Tax=Cryoendolithus antarcticus TaxID=1507870 RepID=A0A1V8TRJ6_9PEZI|nr:hypothetical protein B0A48_00842 [Cryoendolithus antarcticus]